MSDPTSDRKVEHIRIIESDAESDRHKLYFDRLHLSHRALPEIARDEVDASTTFLGKRLSFPLLISSMTGGTHDRVQKVNRHLAIAAEATGVAMSVGSQRVLFTHPESRASFALRPFAPNALLLANLGAVQLNYGFTPDHCAEAVEVLEADGLYLHLNPLQEAIQPEGNTNFTGLARRIAEVCDQLSAPVLVKEVGAGLSPADAQLLIASGVRYIDVAGAGGTSWSRIEHHRRNATEPDSLGLAFQDWGLPTPLALRLLRPYREQATLIASGGIRTGIDMVKAVVLGASMCGLAAPFLRPAMESPERVIEVIKGLQREFETAMFLLGARTLDDIHGREELFVGEPS